MSLKPWWQVAVPQKRIRKGDIDESLFAAKLGDVINNRAAIDYQDPVLFFKGTYLTKGLTHLLNSVCQRLRGEGGVPVIRVITPFGGGKTHSLIAIYHLLANKEKLEKNEVWNELIKIIKDVPKAKIAAIDGEDLDVIEGRKVDGFTLRTLWGEITYQLGGKEFYEKIKEHDKKRICPGKEILFPILKELQPFVILIDEFIHYLIKTKALDKEEGTNLTDGTLSFLQHLSEIVSSLDKAAMVVSLPASVIEAPEELLEKAKRYIGRVETIETPVEGEEVYEIIRRRLFEDLGNEKEHVNVAQRFFEMYLSLSEDVPKRVREIAYKNKIIKAYPFHPETIDVLMDKWGSIPSFQRTRGALRLLARVVADLYNRREHVPLILPSNINLVDPSIRGEFIKHIGQQFESVIFLDIEKNAKEIDDELGSEYAKYKLGSGMAISIFIHSFSGRTGVKKGVGLPTIRICMLTEKEINPLISDVANRLAKKLYYIYFEGDFYWFSGEPNLNKTLVDKKEIIKDEEIRESIFSLISANIGKDLESCIWPEEPKDVPDIPKIQIVVAPLYKYWPNENTEEYINTILENYSTTFRRFKNALIFLVPAKETLFQLREVVREYLGWKKIDEDMSIVKTLTEDQRKLLKNSLEESRAKTLSSLYECYRHVFIPSADGLKHLDLGTRVYLTAEKISEKVRKFLEDSQELLPKIDPPLLLKGFSKDAEEKGMCNIKELYENFLKWKELPMIEGEQALIKSVKDGVSQGIFALGIGDERSFSRLYYSQSIAEEIEVSESFWIIKKDKFSELGLGKEVEKVEEVAHPEKEEISGIALPKAFKHVQIIAETPWDKITEIFSGVIRPLRKDVRGRETEMHITINIDVKSDEGIPAETLDMKVEETLKQIKAKYKIEKS